MAVEIWGRFVTEIEPGIMGSRRGRAGARACADGVVLGFESSFLSRLVVLQSRIYAPD